jgi:hypothetical protein
MSAMGQNRTLFTVPFYVCFTPESGHLSACAAGRIYEYTPFADADPYIPLLVPVLGVLKPDAEVP